MPATATLDRASFAAALKEHYKQSSVENMVYKSNPLLALIKKYTKFGGLNMPIPIISANPAGRSATFATAQANKMSSEIDRFVLTRVKDYAIASIDSETMESSQGDANAFMNASTTEIDGALHAVSRSLAKAMYGDGSGSLGAVTGVSGTTLTMSNPGDITNIEVNMKIVSAADADSAITSTAARTVETVDRAAGSFTIDLALGGTSSDGDLIFAEGDYTDSSRSKVSGLAAWLPESVGGSDNHFGLDRAKDPSRLAGVFFDGSALPIEEALIDGSSLVGREGGRPDHCFMSFSSYASLEKALGAKVNYTDVSAKQGVGFKALEVHAPTGTIKVIPDLNCQDNTAWLLQMDTWSLNSLGAAPKLLGADGNRVLREAAADAIEVRVGYYAQMACKAPGWNGQIKLA